MNTTLRDALSQAVTELYKMGGEMPLMLRVNLIKLGVVKTYEFYLSTLVRLVRSVYQGYIGGEFIDIMANLVQGQINQAYGQAWLDEGDGSTMPDYLTGAATAFILQQYGFVDQYYRDIVDARIDGTSLDPLLARADMWAGQYDTAYRDALLLIRTDNGGNLVWRKGQTEQGCDTCARLDGLVMSAKDWEALGLHPRGYPNPQLACEGGGPANNCDCTLEPTDQRKSPKAKDAARDIVMGTRKHYGPGAHPGTGTSQDVHGEGNLLHGTSADFNEFRLGTSGAVYFSERRKDGRITQAEQIAQGRYGGRLVSAIIDESRVKRFNPINDPVAAEIYKRILGEPKRGDLISYADAHDLFPAASASGYNYFRVVEEGGVISIAITDTSIITIISNVDVRK